MGGVNGVDGQCAWAGEQVREGGKICFSYMHHAVVHAPPHAPRPEVSTLQAAGSAEICWRIQFAALWVPGHDMA